MADIHIEKNLQIYNAPDVTAYYAALNYLTPCERLLFESYISPGSAVLDLGVGGGRTTPYLASRATRYVGVDNAEAMVRACQQKFPDLEFVTADAGDLSAFPDAVFDAVVFAFNGIDFVLPDKHPTAVLYTRSSNSETRWCFYLFFTQCARSPGSAWLEPRTSRANRPPFHRKLESDTPCISRNADLNARSAGACTGMCGKLSCGWPDGFPRECSGRERANSSIPLTADCSRTFQCRGELFPNLALPPCDSSESSVTPTHNRTIH